MRAKIRTHQRDRLAWARPAESLFVTHAIYPKQCQTTPKNIPQ